jgi:hypothetical protein
MTTNLKDVTAECAPKAANVTIYTRLVPPNGGSTPLENIDVTMNGKTESSGSLGLAVFAGLEAGKAYDIELKLGKKADECGWDGSEDPVWKVKYTTKVGDDNQLKYDARPLPKLKITVNRLEKDKSTRTPEPKIEVFAVPGKGAEVKGTSADKTGLVEFKALKKETYKVGVRLSGAQEDTFLLPPTIDNVALALGDEKSLSIDLKLKGTLRVEVERWDGKALSKPAKVTVKQVNPAKTLPVKDTVAGKDAKTNAPLGIGEFKLAEGKYKVTIQTQDEEKDWKIAPTEGKDIEVEVKSDEIAPLRFSLTPYKKVQFVAFDIRPGVRSPKQYLGDKDTDKDIEERCSIMRDVISGAAGLGTIDKLDSTLKVFMAPEFYFRGAEGGYPVEKISTILDEKVATSMMAEIQKTDYKHWLFVMGTAIGYLPHEQTDKKGDPLWWGSKASHSVGPMRVHQLQIHEFTRIGTEMKVRVDPVPEDFAEKGKSRWQLRQKAPHEASQQVIGVESGNGRCWLKLEAPDAFQTNANVDLEISGDNLRVEDVLTRKLGNPGKDVTVLVVRSSTCKQIIQEAKKIRWRARQKARPLDVEAAILGIVESPSGIPEEYWIFLDSTANFKKDKPLELVEPIGAEVFNVALVRRGGPDPKPAPPGLRQAIVFKEYISSIDFLGKNNNEMDFYDEKGHQILIYGKTRTALPTAGSRDVLHDGGKVNESEINKSGEGGGSVFTMDGIAFGLEICLDHAQQRLYGFYTNSAKVGDPLPQVYLIPSWGMTIGGGPTYALPETPIFNVDGGGGGAVARMHSGQDYCEQHTKQTPGAAPFPCPAKDCRSFLVGPVIKGLERGDLKRPGLENFFDPGAGVVIYEAKPIPDAKTV